MPHKDLITTRLKLKDLFPDLAEEYPENTEFIRKGITPANLEIKEGERAVISYITTGAIDRDQEIIRPSGASLSEYRKNPVVLFGHNYSALPIGKNMWIKSDEKGLIAKTKYANHEEADKVYEYRKDGFPLAESIGFIPTQSFYKRWTNGGMEWGQEDLTALKRFGYSAEDLEKVRAVYTKWILLEYSDVAVPANPEATQIAIGKGLIPGESIKIEGDSTETIPEGEIKIIDKDSQSDFEEAVEDDEDEFIENLSPDEEIIKGLEDKIKVLEDKSEKFDSLMDNISKLIEHLAPKEIETEEIELDFELKDVKTIVKDKVDEHNESTINILKQFTQDEFDRLKGKIISTEGSEK